MPYLKRVHYCDKPGDGKYGDIWQCDVVSCGRIWTSVFYSVWRPSTAAEIAGLSVGSDSVEA